MLVAARSSNVFAPYNHFFCDSWVVGFWRADHEEHIIGFGSRVCTVVEAVPGQVRAQEGRRMAAATTGQRHKQANKTVCARLVMRHSCDVGYLASVPGVQGGSGMRRELRWPVK